MADLHITRDLLQAASRGEIPPRLLTQLGVRHLMTLCPHCREEILAWQRERDAGPADYDRAFRVLPAVLGRHTGESERQQEKAEREAAVLLRLPQEERLGKVRRARSRFRGTALARILLDESRRQIPSDPDESFHLAELARTILHGSPEAPGIFDLLALATACMANARRAAGALRDAEGLFGHARYVISQHGVTDTEVLARIDELEGSLRKDQRRFEPAEELLTRSAMLYRVIGATVETARVLLNLGSLSFYRGMPDQAIVFVRTALEEIPADTQPRLYLNGRHNLASYLAAAGRFEEAADVLETDEDLYRRFPEPWTQLRLAWLRGKIAAGRGKVEAAERSLLEARDGFLRSGIGYDAAMVSLDLALLYLRQERNAEIRRLAEEMFPVFEAQDVHREALAALRLFQEAARREEVTVELVQELAVFFRDVRVDPSLRFR
jgi:tetratricopeptide (TPR) repeat protein